MSPILLAMYLLSLYCTPLTSNMPMFWFFIVTSSYFITCDVNRCIAMDRTGSVF